MRTEEEKRVLAREVRFARQYLTNEVPNNLIIWTLEHYAGLVVTIDHEREKRLDLDGRGEFLPGGTTTVVIYDPKSEAGTFGIARCNPKDPFTKKIGVRLALTRALGMGVTK